MKHYFFLLLLLIFTTLTGKAQTEFDMSFLPPSHSQIDEEQEMASNMAEKFDSISKNPSFNPEEFEKIACFFIDDLISNNYLLAAGVLIHKSFNILIEHPVEDLFLKFPIGLVTSTGELYLRGGALNMANKFIEDAYLLNLEAGGQEDFNYIRNAFNLASLLCRVGQTEAASEIFSDMVRRLNDKADSINSDEVNAIPFTVINAMLYCALLLTDSNDRNFFSDLIQVYKKIQNPLISSMLMFTLFGNKILMNDFEDYETVYEKYNKLSILSPALYSSLGLTDAMENAWHYDAEKYLRMLPEAHFYSQDMIANNLNSFSENDTEFYWDDTARKLNHAFGIGFNNLSDNHIFLNAAFLNSAFTKSLSIQNSRNLRQTVEEGDNKWKKDNMTDIKSLKQKIGNSTDSLLRHEFMSSVNDKEWRLRVSSSMTDKIAKDNNMTVLAYKKLDPDECYVEITEYPFLNEDGTEIPHYGAIILCPKPIYDERNEIEYYADTYDFVDLGPTLAWRVVYSGLNDNFDYHRKAGQYSPEEIISVSNFIIPLAKKIENFRRAYISSTGVLNTVNIGALNYGEEGKPLNETVEIAKVYSPLDLYAIKDRKSRPASASVYSNINYSKDGNSVKKPESGPAYRVNIEKGGNLKKFYSLPIDEDALVSSVKKSTSKINLFSGEKATEENFKSLDGNSTELIHIDSHGFYIPESDNEFLGKHKFESTRERALLTCGLPLAGANIAWSGKDIPEGKEDGILTAWEISCMDLSNCKLAVLSACETAQGDLDPINGVMGLQRALKIAGVQSMLLTLWPVDNELTQEFINSFYLHLPVSKDYNAAFIATQQEFRKRHPDPYHWAPFILIN